LDIFNLFSNMQSFIPIKEATPILMIASTGLIINIAERRFTGTEEEYLIKFVKYGSYAVCGYILAKLGLQLINGTAYLLN